MSVHDKFMPDVAAELAEEASEEALKAPPVGALEACQQLGAELNRVVADIERAEKTLNELKQRKYQITTKELVEVMDRARIEDFSVDGSTFVAAPYYKASIPEEYRDVAHQWLEEHEAGDIINRTVIVSFPKDSEEEARALQDYIRSRYQMAQVEEKRLVPWKRLTSWLKELVELNDPEKILPPMDIMGATVGRVVQIKEKRR